MPKGVAKRKKKFKINQRVLTQKLEATEQEKKFKSTSVFICLLVAQLCLTLWKLMYCSLPASSVTGFSRQEYWSKLPFPSLGDLPNPRIEPGFPALQAESLLLSHQGSPYCIYVYMFGPI